MNNYFVLFSVPAKTMAAWMETVPPEERKKQGEQMMKDWGAWQEKHKAQIKDNGMPLGKTKRVTKDSITDVKNDLNYYIIVEADSHEAAAKLVKDNPHVMTIPDAYVDVMEIPHMGM